MLTHNFILISIVAGYEEDTFDVVLSGIITPVCLPHEHDLLAEFARILKPSGLLIISEPIVNQGEIRIILTVILE